MADRGINKVILVGNTGRDPETRYTKDNKAIANLSLATSDSWTDRNTNERQERTEWHRVVFFGRLAEVVDKYVKRGDKLFVEGRLQTRKWEDQRTGQDRYTTEIVASEMVMLGGGGDRSGSRDRQDSGGGAQSNDDSGRWQQRSDESPSSTQDADDFSDDLPW